MEGTADLAITAALVGEPARAAMLLALMDGRALTAGELARAAGVMPQTASAHLARLAEAGLLAVHRQGRHHYHRLASPAVAQMLETIVEVGHAARPEPRRAIRTGPRDRAMRQARTCFGHLAGTLGVTLADRLGERGHIVLTTEGGAVTDSGLALFREFGVAFDAAPHGGAPAFCRPCLDWSERRLHVGGRLGAALAARCFALGWLERRPDSRAVTVTAAGRHGFAETFGATL